MADETQVDESTAGPVGEGSTPESVASDTPIKEEEVEEENKK